MRIKSIIIATSVALLICSCESMPKSWKWGAKPRPLTGVRNFPSTDTEYGKGFKNGCVVAMDIVGAGLVRDLNKFSSEDMNIYPDKLFHSPDFSTGWDDGFEQCTYILDWDVV